MNDSVEAKIVESHIRRYTQDEVIVVLHTSKTRVSRSIRHFRETHFILDASRVGHPSKVRSSLESYN
jgi:hypothetical protein